MLLLEKIFSIINDSGLLYCVQNKYEEMPENIPSDVDMMYMNANEAFLDRLVLRIQKETGLVLTQKICQGYFEFTYILMPRCPQTYFQLQLDFYRSISRKGFLNVMPAEEMIKTRRFYKCFFIPDPFIEFKYMWIRRAIKNDFNYDHLKILNTLLKNDNEHSYFKLLEAYFSPKTIKFFEQIIDSQNIDAFKSNYSLVRRDVKRISKSNCSPIIYFKYMCFMLFTVFPKRFIHKCGISIAFLGSDGCGKTTAIKSVQPRIMGSFYKLNMLYFRPHLFKNLGSLNAIHPKGEETTNPNPHSKQLNNRLKSFLRFMFYNFDFLFGTLFLINKLKRKKELIIFDRYYYDYYADKKRYQYKLSDFAIHFWSFLIPSPDIVFILYAKPERIYERKQELSIDEIAKQEEAFIKFSKKNKKTIVIDANLSEIEVSNQIVKNVISYMEKKTKRILKK